MQTQLYCTGDTVSNRVFSNSYNSLVKQAQSQTTHTVVNHVFGPMRKYSQVNREDRTAQFATELAAALHELHVTHRQLASALGVTLAAVDSWCRITNPTRPGEQNLGKLCTWLDERTPGAGARLLAIATPSTHQSTHPLIHLSTSLTSSISSISSTTSAHRPPTSFIGRAQALQDIAAQFAGAQPVRLLSLIGPGGIGKTRLATQVTTELVAEFDGGIWWVDVTHMSEGSALPVWQTLARALNIHEADGRSLAEQVVTRLHRTHTLLIFDNCEQAIAACAAVASRLLRECPTLAILATSREPLQLSEEVVYPVPSLSLPPIKQSLKRGQLAQFEATRLFMERAFSAQQNFALSDKEAKHIADVCRRLDGLALAIELAASCLPQLNIEQIAQGLNDRFALLSRGSSLAPERHQTLRATIAWSYDLLSAEERTVFAQLAVFAGGWTEEAAYQTTDDGRRTIVGHLSSVVHRLSSKSLIIIEERNQTARYRMLESIHEFAREQLATLDNARETHQRHAEYFAQLAERGQRELNGTNQSEWLNTLDAEQDNFRAALEWARDGNLIGLRLCAALWPFWLVRGYLSEGRAYLDWALGHTADAAPDEIRAALWHGAGALARQQVDYVAANQHYAQAISVYRQINQPLALAQALNELGIVVTAQGQPNQAQMLYQESLNLSDHHDDPHTAATALFGLGLLAYERQAFELAQSYLQASAQAAKDCGDEITLLRALNGLGELARAQNKLPAAQTHYQESLRLSKHLGHKQGQASAWHNLGYVSKTQGQAAESLAYFRQSLSAYQELEEQRGIAECLVGIASVLAEHDNDEATRYLLAAAHLILNKLGVHLTATEQAEFDRTAQQVGLDATMPTQDAFAKVLINHAVELAQQV